MKRNINIDRKTLASDEINATKDFSALASKIAAASKVSPKTPKGNTGWIVGGISALVITAGLYFGKKSLNPTDQAPVTTITKHIDSTATKFVSPPSIEANVNKETYKINADNGGKINHFTGTEITIPEGAFTDENGNIVKGEVEIQYREFHDQADIYLSGIPMSYDTLGENRIFESAGMMEIRGFQNGKRLKITPNKNFRICMHTKNPDPKFNVYYLDEEDKKWDYEGKDSISIPELELIPTSTTSRIEDVEINNEKKESKKEIATVKKEVEVIQKEIRAIKKTEPTKPIKADKNKKNFTIDVMKSEYPELAMYEGTIFEVKKNKDLPEDTYKVTWNDVKLKERNGTYLVQLSKGDREETIDVVPVLEGKNYEEAKLLFDNKFGKYSTQLTKKEGEESLARKKLAKLKERYKKEKEKYEREMIAMRDRMNVQQASNVAMQRVFKINRFGTWNCDTPVKYPRGMIVRSNYVDNNGTQLAFINLNLIEKERNACFPLTPGMIRSLPYNPKKTNVLWGVTIDGKIAVAKSDQFQSTGKEHTFEMKLIDVKGKSNQELKALLNS